MAMLPYYFQNHIAISVKLCRSIIQGVAILLMFPEQDRDRCEALQEYPPRLRYLPYYVRNHIAIAAEIFRSVIQDLPFCLTASRIASRSPRSL